jgi:hypothetical protein
MIILAMTTRDFTVPAVITATCIGSNRQATTTTATTTATGESSKVETFMVVWCTHNIIMCFSNMYAPR